MVDALDRLSGWLCRLGIWASAALLVYMVVHVAVEIVLRSFFDSSTYSLDEFVGYAIASMTFLSLGHTFRERRLIRVNLLKSATHGRARTLAELLCIAFTFAMMLFLTAYIWRALARDWSRGTVSPTLMETPIWLVESVFFCGLVIFLLQLVVSAIQVVRLGVEDDSEEPLR